MKDAFVEVNEANKYETVLVVSPIRVFKVKLIIENVSTNDATVTVRDYYYTVNNTDIADVKFVKLVKAGETVEVEDLVVRSQLQVMSDNVPVRVICTIESEQ